MDVLDEVQRQPELFAVLRSVIDQRRRDGEAAGQFLLLGSASGVLLRQTSESLAGCVAQFELGPFQLREVYGSNTPCLDMNPLWVRGGFALSWLATDDAASLRWVSVQARHLELTLKTAVNAADLLKSSTLARG